MPPSQQLYTDKGHSAVRDQEFPPFRDDRRKHPVRKNRLLADIAGCHDPAEQGRSCLPDCQGLVDSVNYLCLCGNKDEVFVV